MKFDVNYSGFCPEQQEDYSISITCERTNYLEDSIVEKLQARCNYALDFGCKYRNACPIYKNAKIK
nr:MAG TPA: hypothetical protein [Caudoviricetes sp.]